MTLLLTNARLATFTGDEPYGLIDDGAIAIDGARISYVGPRTDAPSAHESHDCGGALITPGLIDPHTHLVYGGNRAREWEQRLAGASYADIAQGGGGILSTVRATRAASEDELLHAAVERARTLCANGVTTVEIKSGYGLTLEDELRMLRIARRVGSRLPLTVCATFLGAHAIPPEYAGRADAYIELVCDVMLPRIAREGLADAVDAFCETIAFSPAQITRLFTRAAEVGLRVKLHADQLTDSGGAALAARFRALSADHLEYVSDAGIEALARAGTVAVVLPGAYYFLREHHAPPVARLRAAGVPIALATDCNPGTSPVLSPLLAMNFACTLFGFTPEEALLGFTVEAARALGVHAERGTIAVGTFADLAVWNVAHPAELAYALGARPCVAVYKDGQRLTTSEG
jgi:imidazolonepropionase